MTDGDTLTFADGREVRLVGIQAPKLPLGRANFKAWPMATEAKAMLEHLTLGRELIPYVGGVALDRHGRHLVHLFTKDGLWVQGEMLRLGFARVYTFADNRAVIPQMLAKEAEARRKNAGMWALGEYQILTPEEAADHVDGYHVVEGTVVSAAKVKGRVYLNFGADWRTDFTLALSSDAVKLFTKDLLTLETKRVRARGWIDRYNGPMIDITHPEQLEILQ